MWRKVVLATGYCLLAIASGPSVGIDLLCRTVSVDGVAAQQLAATNTASGLNLASASVCP